MRMSLAIATLLQLKPIAAESTIEADDSDLALASNNLWSSEDGRVKWRIGLEQKVTGQPKKSFRNEVVRHRILKNASNQAVECDPTSTNAASNPDIGILSCEGDSFCMKDAKSSLGGFCVESSREAVTARRMKKSSKGASHGVDRAAPQEFASEGVEEPEIEDAEIEPPVTVRAETEPPVTVHAETEPPAKVDAETEPPATVHAETEPPATVDAEAEASATVDAETSRINRGFVYCDPSSPSFGILQCDCEDFDLESNTGSFECTYDSYCFGHVSECCAETCAKITLSYRSEGEGSYNYEVCYSFETPYQQSFCHGRSKDLTNYTPLECFGSFNGNSCDACYVNTTTYGTMMDCEEVGLGRDVLVEDFYPPILTNCYASCSVCTICPDVRSGNATNSDSYISFSDTTSCSFVAYLGSLGYFGGPESEACMLVVDSVREECCEQQTEDKFAAFAPFFAIEVENNESSVDNAP